MSSQRYDFVEVYNGGDELSPMLGKFCGKIAPSPIISSGSQLLIKFVSDYETHGAGFSVRYEVFKTASVIMLEKPFNTTTALKIAIAGPECSRNFTAPRGVIKTPGFPEKYPNNLDCTFMIFAPQMSEIVVEFDSFDMEPDTTPPPGALCRYDWLEIWDGFPADFACMEPLGMELGEITSEQISASSQYNSNWSPERSRLNYEENGWTPSDDTVREWVQVFIDVCLQGLFDATRKSSASCIWRTHFGPHMTGVDMGFLRFVTAIGTQGAISKETKKHYYVRSYKVDLSSNGEDWVTVKEGSKQKIFEGNHNPTDEARSFLPKQTLARYIRVRPMSWEQGICMRFEIYGCRTSDYPCSGMLGMVSGQISDAQISASSYADRGWVAENARLLTGRSGWTGQQTKQPFRNEWLQVDLGQDKMVSGVVIQGGKHRDRNVFMKRFRVGHSLDGEGWTIVKEDNTTKPKNQDTPELRSTGSLMTRFIRIYPERATSEGLGLRLELLGCELDAPPTTPGASTLPMTTFGATTTAPPTAPGTTAGSDCEDGRDCGAETEDSEDYDTVTAGRATAVEPILDFIPAYVWFACNFDFSSFCGWTRETGTGAEWLIQTNGAPTVHRGPTLDHTGGLGNFIYMQLGDSDTQSKTGEHDDDEEEKVASLASLPITATDSDLCMSFWYHMFGEHAGALHVRQRREEEAGGQILWTLSGHQGSRWREGRVRLPHSSLSYQIIDGLSMEDCKDPETPTSPPTEIFILPMDSLSQDNSELGGPGNMLKTLDPILITIIAMSALGVFLGAICGVVLYCACSQGSLTDRNLSALENYNFELVDGVKLKKDKMNGQNNYSEA
ncbi:hypothetical protein JOQ06_001328 [Pogonophryne albipinna]|uniref:Neuropilin n=1 Tax=Pogonophryne albipinna TaxID=1090488 RepID=A0AAD6B6W2_9TELE|nr:hypothetical protein JOQ06_001328 [Pogonophryne albipinna]